MIKKLFFILNFILITPYTYSAKDPEIFALKLEELCLEDGSGKYDIIMKQLGFKYKVFPAARSRQYMLDNNACLFPVDMSYLEMKKPLIQSAPLTKIDIKIFSIGKKYSIDDLHKLRIGMRNGLMYGPKMNQLQKKLKLEYVSNLEQNILKLKSKRIDAIIEFELDVVEYSRKNSSLNLVEGKEKIDTLSEAIVCVKNEKNQVFIDKFNKVINSNREKIDKMLNSSIVFETHKYFVHK